MSKPIDKEREAFEAAFPIPPGIVWSGKEYVTSGRQEVNMFVHLCRVAAAYDKMHAVWQARASVRPAGGAVPEFLPCDVRLPPATTIKRGCATSALLASLAMRESLPADHQQFATPHPVSGEQNVASVSIGVDTLKWWRQLIDLNPADLAPRLDAAIASHRAQQGEQKP